MSDTTIPSSRRSRPTPAAAGTYPTLSISSTTRSVEGPSAMGNTRVLGRGPMSSGPAIVLPATLITVSGATGRGAQTVNSSRPGAAGTSSVASGESHTPAPAIVVPLAHLLDNFIALATPDKTIRTARFFFESWRSPKAYLNGFTDEAKRFNVHAQASRTNTIRAISSN